MKRTYCAGPSVLSSRCHIVSFPPSSSIKRSRLGIQEHGTSPLHQYQISVEASRRCRDMLIGQSDAEEVEVNARGSLRFLQKTPPV